MSFLIVQTACIQQSNLPWVIYSTTKINFLDVAVTKVGKKLETDLYCKPIGSHHYLHAQSCHRNVYKRSITYGQAMKIKRICSTEEKINNCFE